MQIGFGLGLGFGRSVWTPGALFADGSQGAWYDPSDFSTLFQDSAGTTALTAVEQGIGKMLDKSGRGNHVLQATTTSRPLESARVNKYRSTESLTNSTDWVVSATGVATPPVVTGGFTGPNGRLAFRVQIALNGGVTSTDFSQVTQNSIFGGFVTGAAYKTRFYVRAYDAANVGKTFASRHAAGAGATLITLQSADTWQLVEFSEIGNSVVTAATPVYLRGGSGASDSIDLLVAIPDLRAADDYAKNIPAYQCVNTSTDYGTAGFPLFAVPDGVDDNLASTTGGGGTAGFLLCAAITVNGGAGTSRVLWNDIGSNTGYIVSAGSGNTLRLDAGNGTAYTAAAGGALPVGETHVVMAWDDGSNLNVQVDNGTVTSVARPVVAAGGAGFTLFKSNVSASAFLSADCHQLVYIKDTAKTANERALLKRFVGAKAGLSL